jgi:Flp pilus assembly protein TadD
MTQDTHRLAHALLGQGRVSDLRALADGLRNGDDPTGRADGHRLTALLALLGGDANGAVAEAGASAALRDDPHTRALLALARATRGDADVGDALEETIAFAPGIPHLYAAAANAVRKARPDAAEALLRLGVMACPDDVGMLQSLVMDQLQRGRWHEVEAGARRLVALQPDWQHSHNLGSIHRQIGRIAEAEHWARRAIAIAPEEGSSWSLLGRLLRAQDRFDEAIETFRTSQIVEKPDPAGFNGLLEVLVASGRPVEAHVLNQRKIEGGDFVLMGGMDPHAARTFGEPALLAGHKDSKVKWHKPEAINWFPMEFPNRDSLDAMIRETVLDPKAPLPKLFGGGSRILTFGSCFAIEIRAALAARNVVSETLQIPEGLNNTFALRSFIEWSLTGRRSEESYWYDNDEERGALRWEAPEEQRHYAEMMRKADGFVITAGLSEVWRDRKTGGVFWRGVPDYLFSADRHELVLSTVAENCDNLRAIHALIQEHCGEKPVIVTVSPIPLMATFRSQPCVVADAASKSILRAAVEQLLGERHPNLFYWPSFEVVRWLGAHLSRPTFGTPNAVPDTRHVPREVVEAITSLFLDCFFTETPAAP